MGETPAITSPIRRFNKLLRTYWLMALGLAIPRGLQGSIKGADKSGVTGTSMGMPAKCNPPRWDGSVKEQARGGEICIYIGPPGAGKSQVVRGHVARLVAESQTVALIERSRVRFFPEFLNEELGPAKSVSVDSLVSPDVFADVVERLTCCNIVLLDTPCVRTPAGVAMLTELIRVAGSRSKVLLVLSAKTPQAKLRVLVEDMRRLQFRGIVLTRTEKSQSLAGTVVWLQFMTGVPVELSFGAKKLLKKVPKEQSRVADRPEAPP